MWTIMAVYGWNKDDRQKNKETCGYELSKITGESKERIGLRVLGNFKNRVEVKDHWYM